MFDRLTAMVTEGQEPVARTESAATPTGDEETEAPAEESGEKKEAEPEKPKLIIASH